MQISFSKEKRPLTPPPFDTMQEAVVLIERWRAYYNTVRPHSALDYRPPAPEFKVVDISLKLA
jgi:transposase InsO family protein